MKLLAKSLCISLLFFMTLAAQASGVVNVFVWSDAIPQKVIQQFEQETGIRVNFNIYENTETLIAKLRASNHSLYDVIEPSSYYVSRMERMGMLEKLDKSRLPNIKHLDPFLMNRPYDPNNDYSLPYIWGITGIFINTRYYQKEQFNEWKKLWNPELKNELAVIDDPREVFSVVLRAMGESADETDPEKLNKAFLKLQTLLPNIKLFGTDLLKPLMIDEDARIGISWNGDAVKSRHENPDIDFIFPEDGALIWLDCLAIVKNAPNMDNAYKFVNFLMRPDIAEQVALEEGYTIANLSARKRLPEEIQNDPIAYPTKEMLAKAIFQGSVNDEVLTQYSRYWTLLKLRG